MTRYPIATCVSDRALLGLIQPRKSTDAPQHHPDVSLRGAKRRGNLAGPGPITGQPRRIRRLLREIATSAYGLLAMTNLGALLRSAMVARKFAGPHGAHAYQCLCGAARKSGLRGHEAGCAAVGGAAATGTARGIPRCSISGCFRPARRAEQGGKIDVYARVQTARQGLQNFIGMVALIGGCGRGSYSRSFRGGSGNGTGGMCVPPSSISRKSVSVSQ